MEDILRRRDEMAEWLRENHPEVSEQRHLDAGTEARAYWHHGYMMALSDVLRRLAS